MIDLMHVENRHSCISWCLKALHDTWRFSAWDNTTWSEAGVVVLHITVATYHARQAQIEPSLRAILLQRAGKYTCIALSRFDDANHLLNTALAAHTEAGDKMSLPLAQTLCELGKVLRFLGDYSTAESMLGKTLNMLQILQSSSNTTTTPTSTLVIPATGTTTTTTTATTPSPTKTESSQTGDECAWLIATATHELGVVKLKQGVLTSVSLSLQSTHRKETYWRLMINICGGRNKRLTCVLIVVQLIS